MMQTSYIDLRRSHIGEYVKLSLFPTTDVEGIVFECLNGCRTEYDTPLRWWVEFRNLLGRFIICPVCKFGFCNSGAEAIEAAIKLARKYAKEHVHSDRFEIIAAQNSFHGRTLAALTATGQAKFQKGFEPLVPGFRHVPFNDILALRGAVNEKTCAVLLEPVQGEGGVKLAEDSYLKEVRTLFSELNILLILDEVQTGMGRTGKLFAHEHFGITPDIMAIAKGLGGGVPIGAMLATDRVATGFQPGNHASTFGGNP